ncbi:MAG: RHS repeat-associated core domain-containing protein, partial [Candidatus Sedimenticola sp. (ex Thyasira tokunagai)]
MRGGDWRAGTLTNRGFTGHEHVDEMDLIHMNGRVYDPTLGRFLSADPTMQSPYSSQGFNRYSYVHNNPLKYTDPSGYFFKSLFKAVKKLFKNKIVRAIVGIAAAWYLGPIVGKALGTAFGVTSQVGLAALTGASGGFIGGFIASGGDLRTAAIGAITGGAAGYIGASSAFG